MMEETDLWGKPIIGFLSKAPLISAVYLGDGTSLAGSMSVCPLAGVLD
jgi:hypothetical protein